MSLGVVLSVVGAVVAFMAVFATMIAVQSQRRESRYRQEEHRSELESYRRFTEDRLYKLTEQLLASGDRWRDVNHLLVDSQTYQKQSSDTATSLTPFLHNAGLSSEDLTVDSRLVLVLTPFHEDFDKQFSVIVEVCRELGLTAVRGDEEYHPRDILAHVLGLLVRARLVVANLDGRNPNVYYELGIAHALNKPTILVGTSLSEVPFDVRGRKIVLADSTDKLKDDLRSEISRSLV